MHLVICSSNSSQNSGTCHKVQMGVTAIEKSSRPTEEPTDQNFNAALELEADVNLHKPDVHRVLS